MVRVLKIKFDLCAGAADEQNQCLAVVNAAINELNRNSKSTQEMGKATECTYIVAAGRCVYLEVCVLLSTCPLVYRIWMRGCVFYFGPDFVQPCLCMSLVSGRSRVSFQCVSVASSRSLPAPCSLAAFSAAMMIKDRWPSYLTLFVLERALLQQQICVPLANPGHPRNLELQQTGSMTPREQSDPARHPVPLGAGSRARVAGRGAVVRR